MPKTEDTENTIAKINANIPEIYRKGIERHREMETADEKTQSTINAERGDLQESTLNSYAFLFELAVKAENRKDIAKFKNICKACDIEIRNQGSFCYLLGVRYHDNPMQKKRVSAIFRYAYEVDGLRSGAAFIAKVKAGNDEDKGTINRYRMMAEAYYKQSPEYDFAQQIQKLINQTSLALVGTADPIQIQVSKDHAPTGPMTFTVDNNDGVLTVTNFEFGDREKVERQLRRIIEKELVDDPVQSMIADGAKALKLTKVHKADPVIVHVEKKGDDAVINSYNYLYPAPFTSILIEGGGAALSNEPIFFTGNDWLDLNKILRVFKSGLIPSFTEKGVVLTVNEEMTDSFEALQNAVNARRAKNIELPPSLKEVTGRNKKAQRLIPRANVEIEHKLPERAVELVVAVWLNTNMAKDLVKKLKNINGAVTINIKPDLFSVILNTELLYKIPLVSAPLPEGTGVDINIKSADLLYAAEVMAKCQRSHLYYSDAGIWIEARRGDTAYDITIPQIKGDDYDARIIPAIELDDAA